MVTVSTTRDAWQAMGIAVSEIHADDRALHPAIQGCRSGWQLDWCRRQPRSWLGLAESGAELTDGHR